MGSHLQSADYSGLAIVHREADIISGKNYIASDIVILDQETETNDKVLIAGYGINDVIRSRSKSRLEVQQHGG